MLEGRLDERSVLTTALLTGLIRMPAPTEAVVLVRASTEDREGWRIDRFRVDRLPLEQPPEEQA